MTTPTERWRSRENPYNVWLTVDAVAELYDYAVQLEHENKLSDERARIWERKTCEAWRDNKALSVNAENLEIVRKQRDEARDIACKLLAWAKTLWRPRFPIRGMAAVEWMNLPEWLRREIEG